jgi:glycolate oxidase FAD binding subunit
MSNSKQDPILEEFKGRILSAIASGQKLRIVGGNTKSWYGDTSIGEELSTTNYSGIVDYQPSELVLTAKAGTPMKEIEQALAKASQWFPFEPPCFGDHSTIGGVVCAGLSGPGRGQYGALRDFVLGVKIMDGRGDILTFGGQVMKNVAGYDVSRLMPGSLGTLGLLLEVSIKVLPIPAKTKTLAIPIEQAQAIEQMNRWASQPLPLSASCWLETSSGSDELMLRIAGANAAVEAANKKLLEPYGGKVVDDQEASAFWHSIKEQTHPFFQLSGQESLWRFAVNPLSNPLPIESTTCIEWLGGQRWVKGNFDQEAMKKIAQLHGGHVTLFRGDKAQVSSVFTSLKDAAITAPLATVQERIRKTFDPHGIFQTNRMP